MGMSPDEFYRMSFAQFQLKVRGFQKGYFKDYEKFRMVGYTVYCSIPSKQQKKSIQNWMPLPTDRKTVNMDKDQMDAIWQKFKNKGK